MMVCGIVMLAATAHADWRKDLLQEHGIPLYETSLRLAADHESLTEEDYRQSYERLASLKFQEREEAQRVFTQAGKSAIGFLDAQGEIEDPEVRFRAREIRKAHESGEKVELPPLLKSAAKSILEKPDDMATGGLFYEWFAENSMDCRKGYRQMIHQGPEGSIVRAFTGRIAIGGNLSGKHDISMMLPSKTWPGTEVLPDRVRISCLMGGSPGLAGTWNVGLRAGNLKVLFHPGHPGGDFRFEQAGSHHPFCRNQDMGFTPSYNELHRMELTISRLPIGKVRVDAAVVSHDGKRFGSQIRIDEQRIGPLDSVGLVRGGDEGGYAMFDELEVKLLP